MAAVVEYRAPNQIRPAGSPVDCTGCPPRGLTGRPAPARRPVPAHRFGAGWILVVATVMALLFLGGHLLGGVGTGEAVGIPERSGQYAVVGPGDTWLSIAREHVPAEAAGGFVAELVALNGGNRPLELGEVVALPVAD